MENMDDLQMQQSQQEVEKELKRLFEQIPEEIPIYLFAQPGINDVFADTARQAIRYFRDLSGKILFREYKLDHELAKKYNVDSAPTILIDPEHYNIRWLGAPLGEEGRIFIEMLMPDL